METKLIELRDRGTFIPMIAIRLRYGSAAELYLLRSAGYAAEQMDHFTEEPYILFGKVNGGSPLYYDPYSWPNRRMAEAHNFLIKNWELYQSGGILDIEFILGETTEPKISQRLE